MLPPVLELVVVWHPGDRIGHSIARRLLAHFHGTAFTGLMGGAVEVFVRSQPWVERGGPPRDILLPGDPPASNGGVAPERTVVVPVLGRRLANVVKDDCRWLDYLTRIVTVAALNPGRVKVFPVSAGVSLRGSPLGDLMRNTLWVGEIAGVAEVGQGTWVRDLIQGLAQFAATDPDHLPGADLAEDRRLTVFISHTRQGRDPGSAVLELSSVVRSVLADSRLASFFDAHDLQIDDDWREQLRRNAGRGALLCLRSDLYSSRDWCQEEVLIAKQAGSPVVMLDALESGEERGSFLMDHTPRLPVLRDGDGWSRSDVERGLGSLVDQCLKRALWKRQQYLAASDPTLQVAWWAPYAPEPLTLAAWLEEGKAAGVQLGGDGEPIRILHPDPPLGEPEQRVLSQVARLAGLHSGLDMITPRLLAARGGG